MKLITKFILLTLLVSATALPVFAEPYPFPVPFVGNRDSVITFKDFNGPGSIKIYSVSGEKVAELTVSPGDLIKQWPVTNSSGQQLASGVYFYVIDGSGQVTTGRLVVIR